MTQSPVDAMRYVSLVSHATAGLLQGTPDVIGMAQGIHAIDHQIISHAMRPASSVKEWDENKQRTHKIGILTKK